MITGPAVLAVNRMELTIFDCKKKTAYANQLCGVGTPGGTPNPHPQNRKSDALSVDTRQHDTVSA